MESLARARYILNQMSAGGLGVYWDTCHKCFRVMRYDSRAFSLHPKCYEFIEGMR